MPVTTTLNAYLESRLAATFGRPLRINTVQAVSGGDINDAYRLETSNGRYMMKLNSKQAYPAMFACECEGLYAIRSTQTIAVPEIILQEDFEQSSFLVMEWIDAVRPVPETSRRLGEQLAAMHQHTVLQYGFQQNNYMGSLPQSNRWHSAWSTFFIEERLQPMVKIAIDQQLLTTHDIQQFELLYYKLPGLFSEEPPALLHGDLWGGNYLISTDGQPFLIDPAVSYGHREFDLSMTMLFGGFGREFYQAYQESFPLVAGWEQRAALWNIYPLLLHLNLFGTSYLGRIRASLKQYS